MEPNNGVRRHVQISFEIAFLIHCFRWCSVDDTSRFFFGDSFGRLAMLSVENVKDFGLILIPLGQV